jgi:hypothetical protein
MRDLKEELEAARITVAHCRRRAERPGSSLEDEFALEKARNRLLTLELKDLRLAKGLQTGGNKGRAAPERHVSKPRSAKEVAEAAFARVQKAGT